MRMNNSELTDSRKMASRFFLFLRNLKDGIERIPDDIIAATHPIRRVTNTKIKKFQDQFNGKRCFIIGNGPSLKNTDLTKLRNEYTFGLNRIYLMFKELGFQTSFLVSINDLVIQQTVKEIESLDMPRFVSWRSRNWLQPSDNLYFLHTTYTGVKFAKNAQKRLWEGATVTYVAMQLAYYFGFSEVVLIGVDHNFVTKGEANKTITSQGDDPNHFHPEYFGKGFRWQLPDLETSEFAYQLAKQYFEADGRQIIDATIGGNLQVFPKVEYASLF